MKNVACLAGVLLLFILFIVPAGAQSRESRARIALFEPAALKADPALKAILSTVADTVELSLTCLDSYEIKRLPAVDPTSGLGKIRSYCKDNRIDQAIGGNASAKKGGGYAFRLVVYDRKTDSITVTREGESKGALDMFDVTDALIESLLQGLSGTHLLFGSLAVETDPPGAKVTVNGRDVGAAPVSLRGLPVGTLRIAATSDGREPAETSVAVADGEESSASLTLERSKGTWAGAVPDDATVTFNSKEIGEKVIEGTTTGVELPTGTYDVKAACPGLAPAAARITINRGETSRWMPWPKGYLAVELPETKVFVDDQDMGLSPAVVVLEPGSPHKVELRREKYLAYQAEVNVEAGNKQVLSPEMKQLPGSIRVETNLSGATVRIESGDYATTPCTFTDLAPGPHKLRMSPLLFAKRYYVCEEYFSVDVKAGEVTTITKTLVPGMARMQLLDAPPGSTVTVDGTSMDPQVLTTGVPIPAGDLDIVLTSPTGQKWKGSVKITNGINGQWRLGYFTALLPRKTIKIDGKGDDWAGIWPQWTSPAPTDMYPNQPGTELTRVYACRDDKFLYCKVDFADGTPTMTLSKDFQAGFRYQLQVRLPNADLLIMEIDSDRRNGTWRWVGVWNGVTSKGTTLEQDFSYKAADSMLEFAVPLSRMERYLAGSPYVAEFFVANANEKGVWLSNVGSGQVKIDFVN
jgi:hypothetical protein